MAGWLPFAVMAQQYTAGTGETVTIPTGTSASSQTGSAISATSGGTITGTDVAASSGTTGNGPVILSSDPGSSVTLGGSTTITGNGTGIRMDNGGQVGPGSGTTITIDGSNSGSAGVVLNNTAVADGPISGVSVNFTTANAHAGNAAWIGVSLQDSNASFDRLNISGNSKAVGFIANGSSTLNLAHSSVRFDEASSGAFNYLWTIGVAPIFSGGTAGYISGANAVVNASDSTFYVSSFDGSGRSGVWLFSAGTFNGERVSFTIGGTSRGLDLQGNATRANLTDSSVTMTDNNSSVGALVTGGVLTGLRSTFTTMGQNSIGMEAQGGGTITLADSTVDAQGAESIAIRAGNRTGAIPGPATVTVSGGTVTSGGTALQATSENSRLTLKDGVRVTGGNGILLDVGSTGVATLVGDTAAVLNGDMQATVVDSATVSLSNNTTWTGAARNIGTTSITGGSTWNMTGNSDVASLRHDSSTIAYSAPTGDPASAASYKTLTIRGDYTGNNGLIALNTYLNSDNSPTDRLVVQGSTAGSGSLRINNTGGLGALTTGDGIKVVEVQGNSAGTFALTGRVAAGLYEYSLYRGGIADPADGNWYLRNVLVPPQPGPVPPEPTPPGPTPPTPAPPTPTPPGPTPPEPTPPEPTPPEPTPPGPTPPEPTPPSPTPPEPHIRSEVPLVSAILPLATEYGYTFLDTLHERVGEIWSENRTQRPTRTWGRMIWNRGFQDNGAHSTSDLFRKGPQYDYTIDGFQLGADVHADETADGRLDQAGFYFGVGRVSADVDDVLGGKAGSIRMDGYSLGGYWTHKSPDGWYSDAVAQGTFYSADAHSVHGEHIKPDGWGFLASLEGGYGIPLDNGYVVEPQAQLIYQTVSFEKERDSFGVFDFENSDSLRGRVGARLSKNWRTGMEEEEKPRMASAWLRGNVWHEFMGDGKTKVATLDGSGDKATITAPLEGTWGEIGVGITGQVTKSTSLFATGSYSHSFDDGGRKAWGARLGVSIQF